MSRPGWENHERDIADMFNLDRTISSGNKWHDPGDAVSRGRSNPFPIYAECKFTEHKSFAVSLKALADAENKAFQLGKRLIMPIRFGRKNPPMHKDYVVIAAHDLAELLDMLKAGED